MRKTLRQAQGDTAGTPLCHSERSEESSRQFIVIRHWKTLRQAQGDKAAVTLSAFFVILSEAKNPPAGLSLSGLGRCFDKLSMTLPVLGLGRPFGRLRVTRPVYRYQALEDASLRKTLRCPTLFWSGTQHDKAGLPLSGLGRPFTA